MPAKDSHHEIVVRSLTKAGWTIVTEQVYLSVGKSSDTHRRLYIDIQAQFNREIVVLIEVKSLERSPTHQLMELIGQYLVYRAALEYLSMRVPLYVAVPEKAYQGIIQHVLGQRIMSNYSIPLLIYDPVQEVIVQWIPPL